MAYKLNDFGDSLQFSCSLKGSSIVYISYVRSVLSLAVVSIVLVGAALSVPNQESNRGLVVPSIFFLTLFLLSFIDLLVITIGVETLILDQNGITIRHQILGVKITQRYIAKDIEGVFVSGKWHEVVFLEHFAGVLMIFTRDGPGGHGGLLDFKQGRIAINCGKYRLSGRQKTFRFGTGLTLDDARQIVLAIHSRFPQYQYKQGKNNF